jgi:hypothetical protein
VEILLESGVRVEDAGGAKVAQVLPHQSQQSLRICSSICQPFLRVDAGVVAPAVSGIVDEAGLQFAKDWFAEVIAWHCYGGRFRRQGWTYLDPEDGVKYWESRTLDKAGRIINRARSDSPQRSQLSPEDAR